MGETGLLVGVEIPMGLCFASGSSQQTGMDGWRRGGEGGRMRKEDSRVLYVDEGGWCVSGAVDFVDRGRRLLPGCEGCSSRYSGILLILNRLVSLYWYCARADESCVASSVLDKVESARGR